MGLSYREDPMIVAWVVLTQCQRLTDRQTDGRTDGQTDGFTIANTALSIASCKKTDGSTNHCMYTTIATEATCMATTNDKCRPNNVSHNGHRVLDNADTKYDMLFIWVLNKRHYIKINVKNCSLYTAYLNGDIQWLIHQKQQKSEKVILFSSTLTIIRRCDGITRQFSYRPVYQGRASIIARGESRGLMTTETLI